MSTGGNEEPRMEFNRRTPPVRAFLPRVVLGLLLGGSFVGIWLTHLNSALVPKVLSWLVVVTVGSLVGGLYWQLALFEGDGLETDSYRYVQGRWHRLETLSIWGLVFAGLAYISIPLTREPLGLGAVAFGLGLVSAPFLWVGVRQHAFDEPVRQKTTFRTALFLLSFVSLCGFAWLETGTNPFDWLVRLGHLGAFSLWVGGAVWHNAIVLPVMRRRPDCRNTLKSQARRFRRHLPIVILLVVVTGGYQTVRLVGSSIRALASFPLGYLIALKVLILTVLVGLVLVKFREKR